MKKVPLWLSVSFIPLSAILLVSGALVFITSFEVYECYVRSRPRFLVVEEGLFIECAGHGQFRLAIKDSCDYIEDGDPTIHYISEADFAKTLYSMGRPRKFLKGSHEISSR